MADLKRRIVAEFSAQNKAKGEMASFRRDMDNTGQAMKRMAMGALASVGGLYALKKGFDYVTKAAMKQEDALFLLEAALRAADEYTDKTMKGFEAFAASIQQATIYGDEEVLALMQLMKSLGVTSAALEKATRMAIGLAAATGRDVKSMSMYIALAQQGEFTMLRRYIPALRSTTDATEQLRIITEFAARGFEIAEAKAETASGSIKQMWNAVSDLAEVAGKPILEPMAGDADTAKWMIEKLTEAIKKNNEAMEEGLITEGGYLKRISTLPEFYENLWKFLTTFEIPEPPRIFEGGGGGRFRGYGAKGGWEGATEIIRFEEPEWLKATLALNTMTEAQKKAAASMYEMSMKARGLSKELAEEKKITQFAALAKERYGADVEGARGAVERFTQALKKSEEVVSVERRKMEALRKTVDVEIELLGRLNEPRQHARQLIQYEAAAMEEFAGNAQAAAAATEDFRDKLEELEEAQKWAEWANTMEQSFAGALERLSQDWRNHGEVAKGVVREILLEMMRIMVWRPVAQAGADWIQMGLGALGGLFSGGGGGYPVGVGSASTPTYVPHAEGGVFTRPHLAMVGEVPEAFVPLSGGRSIPVEMRGGTGPPSFTFVMENQTGTPMKMEKQRQGPNPREFIITVVADDASHGGVLADVFQTKQG